ncbi:hypothetical protein RHGRI_018805 [Rhododendron griersonianum]|uniref:peptidylprolyl isomerase n=1 Tax=Rhododendron griersonianum TaxID=479676 RepID=A0AAV6K2T7_9ERIC|nr:hypothetical protein RHGRI_018805 [Rhododendron griersonianum]
MMEIMPRRSLLKLVVCNPILLNVYPVLGEPMQEMKEPEVIRTQKLASGVRIQDVIEGEGPEAREGNLVEVNYVCRRSNGYFVHSTVDQFSGESSPVLLALDEKQVRSASLFFPKVLQLLLIVEMQRGSFLDEDLKSQLVVCILFQSSVRSFYSFDTYNKGPDGGIGRHEEHTWVIVSGKRRALIPPSAGYINEYLQPVPEEFGPRRSLLSHANEPLVFEVQLLKVL